MLKRAITPIDVEDQWFVILYRDDLARCRITIEQRKSAARSEMIDWMKQYPAII
jgi:hypothetical protein